VVLCVIKRVTMWCEGGGKQSVFQGNHYYWGVVRATRGSAQWDACGCRGPEIIAATRSAKIALSGKEGDRFEHQSWV
jgi:hypothetical protein